MVRPKKDRLVGFNPKINYFKPRGIPVLDLEEVCLTVDEWKEPFGTGRPDHCPSCRGIDFYRTTQNRK